MVLTLTRASCRSGGSSLVPVLGLGLGLGLVLVLSLVLVLVGRLTLVQVLVPHAVSYPLHPLPPRKPLLKDEEGTVHPNILTVTAQG